MPEPKTYRFTSPDGRTIKVNSPDGSIPSEQELNTMFITVKKPSIEPKQQVGFWGKVPLSKYQQGERNIVGNVFERPGAAIRSVLLDRTPAGLTPQQMVERNKKVYTEAAINPGKVPTIQNEILEDYYGKIPNFPGKTAVGNLVSASGYAGDYLTNPADLALSLAPGLSGVKKAGEFLGKTKPARVLEKIGNYPLESIPGKIPGAKIPQQLGRNFKKYQVSKRGSQFEGIRQDLNPMERVKNLKNIAKEKYAVPLAQEEEQLAQKLSGISAKEKTILEKSKENINQNKLNFSQNIDDLTSKMKEETTHLRDNIEIASQKSAVEGKRRFAQFTRENSSAYGSKLDDIVNIAEQEGKLPTNQILKNIFDKTDSEIASTFIDTGVPLTKYNKLKNKYIGGFSEETNPEMQALSKAMGLKKGELKNAGINWSRVNVEQSGFKPPNPNDPINLKELLQDIKSVKKGISVKGQGAERAFSDEDLVSIIFQKNIGEYMSETYPEFAKLQKSYSPIIEQMKAGRKIFKPGAPYELGTAPNILKNPDILEKKLINELEQGTPEFNKGLGQISYPVKKAQNKLLGTEKGYEIARQRIEKLNTSEQEDLKHLLKLREEAYKMAKEKTTVKSIIRQKEIKDVLNKRLQDLEKGQFKGEVGVSKKFARKSIYGKEKKAVTGGGIIGMIDYLIRRRVAKITNF